MRQLEDIELEYKSKLHGSCEKCSNQKADAQMLNYSRRDPKLHEFVKDFRVHLKMDNLHKRELQDLKQLYPLKSRQKKTNTEEEEE